MRVQTGRRVPNQWAKTLALACLLAAGAAQAHNIGEQPTLGDLITGQDLIVRGTITAASQLERGALVATLRVDKVLKGALAEQVIHFVSDPDHGIRYAASERALVFLSPQAASGGANRQYISPQIFAARYTLTSFDPTGYDALVTGVVAAQRLTAPAARALQLKTLMLAQLDSPERPVRLYAAHTLTALGTGRDFWTTAERARIAAYVGNPANDTAVRDILRPLLSAG